MGEVLVAVAILVLISAGLMPAAMSAYRNAVDAANAQVLLSTTVRALRNELSTAWDVQRDTDDEKTIHYRSSTTGSRTKLYVKDSAIMIQDYSDFADVDKKPVARRLVTDAMTKSTGNIDMVITYTGAAPVDDGTIEISGLQVTRKGSSSALAELPKLIIRPLGGGNG